MRPPSMFCACIYMFASECLCVLLRVFLADPNAETAAERETVADDDVVTVEPEVDHLSDVVCCSAFTISICCYDVVLLLPAKRLW